MMKNFIHPASWFRADPPSFRRESPKTCAREASVPGDSGIPAPFPVPWGAIRCSLDVQQIAYTANHNNPEFYLN